ncbi:hypothetical protein MJN85_32400, partial [Salmonella enterica subsp. enterica serovar Anatum]|nr:hypothetical protein [Salmonella enterica subsp. enterica serovar Anatum]
PVSKTADKCDFCRKTNLKAGKQPACVESCPTKALTFGNLDDPTANVPWCLIAVSAPIPYDQDKAWGWLSRARLRNNTPGRSLP